MSVLVECTVYVDKCDVLVRPILLKSLCNSLCLSNCVNVLMYCVFF